TFRVRTPPATASAKPRSAGLMASRARTCGVTGSVLSLGSWPAQPSPPPGDRVADAEVGRVDGVEGADVRGDRVGHLVGVLAGPAVTLAVDADVDVGVDQAGQHHLAGRLDELGVLGYPEVAAGGLDAAVADEH